MAKDNKKYEPSKNSKNVRKLGKPAETGKMVLDYVCSKLDIESFADKSVLDIGCGFRMVRTILENDMEVGHYTGVELDADLIKYLQNEINDPRFDFLYANQKNNYYNPQGGDDFASLNRSLTREYDIITMFSVITHQDPDEARKTFDFARNSIASNGWLVFTACIQGEGHAAFEMEGGDKGVLASFPESHLRDLKEQADSGVQYMEWNPEKPGQMSGYTVAYLKEILSETGWSCLSVFPPFDQGAPVQSTFICKPD
jgi:SAM-dependent methyltransferase